MKFQDAINNARGIGVMSGEEIEAERTAIMNAAGYRCDCGETMHYSAAVGGYRAACGLFESSSGRVIRECGRA